MKHSRRERPLRLALAGIALGLAVGVAAPANAQGEKDDDDGKIVLPPLPEGLAPTGGASPLQEEMKRLFLRVERNLNEIDTMLNDAGAGDVPLGQVDDSGLEGLLRQTRQESKAVVSDIDRILEIAEEMGATKMASGMAEGQPQSGNSPLDEPRDGGPRDREDTPEGPGEEDREQETDGGGKPESPEKSLDEGENRKGDPHRPEAGDPFPSGHDAEHWGVLPERYRELFRDEGGGSFPVQYRDWIDAYYRRLNRQS